MTRFIDGPAKGKTLSLAHAPKFLRVTCEAPESEFLSVKPKFDALDQLSDQAKDTEALYVYVLNGPIGWCFIDYTDKITGRRKGRQEMSAEYRLYVPQPPDEVMRDNTKWQAWVIEENAKQSET